MATERKEKLIRVLQIMETTDEKTPLNAARILEKLSLEYGLDDIDRRSIYKDIEMLQSCGYEIEKHVDPKKGWYMKQHAFEDWELKVMMDAVRQAHCISVEEANKIRERLLKLTSKRGRSRFSHMILPKSGNVEANLKVGPYIETMLEAMYSKRKIEFQYTELNEKMERILRKDGQFYELSLYTIYWADENYYLIGAHDNHDDLTHYRLDRIENLRISDKPTTDARTKIGPNPEDRIQKYIEESVNHFSGQEIRLEVQYDPTPVNNAILHDFAGNDVRVFKQADGTYRASFKKLNSVTLTAWCLQYMNRFTVLKPEQLRAQIISEIDAGAKRYAAE